MPIASAADFVEALREYRILEPAQLEKISRAMKGKSVEPRAVAKELLKQGWVTPYQVNQLLQGRGAELVLGEYLLLDRLGEGGMGQVFKARHRIMERTVAIKVIRKELLAHPDAAQRFQREIRLVAQLDHPHLIRAHDAARIGDTLYLVTEYVEGTDLQRLVQKSGPLSVGHACAYIRQAALGLQAAHERGLVHRDVKPSNLQVSADGAVVKVLDMGLARLQTVSGAAVAAGGLTQAHSVVGTPDYIAPEQIADARSVDSRADIYSLGCTLYFLLAARPPFPDVRWEEKLVYHRKTEPMSIEQVRPDVPPALSAVLRKMMAKRPEDRYSTPAAAADALAPFCQLPGPRPVSGTASPGSLINQPAAGYESGYALPTGSTATPSSASPHQATPIPRPPSAEPTVLVNAQQPTPQASGPPTAVLPSQAISGPRKRLRLILAGGGALLAALVLLAVVLMLKGGKTDDPGTVVRNDTTKEPLPPGPQVLVEENFRTTAEKQLTLPDGWSGDAYRVVKDADGQPCLEVSKPKGNPELMLPPLRVSLSGNFSVEGVVVMDRPEFANYHTLAVLLGSSKGSKPLVLVIDWAGKVLINDDARLPPPNFKPLKPIHFVLTRQGKKLKVKLDDEPVGEKDLDEVAEYDTVSLRLAAGPGNGGRLVRLYGLKVGTLGDDGQAAPSNVPLPDPGDSKKGKRGR